MATSKTNICNSALLHVGSDALITDLDNDNSNEAEILRTFYETALDEVLRDHPWNFAAKYDALALETVAPNSDWAYAYTYPTDCVNMRRILAGTRTGTKIEYAVGASDDLNSKVVYTDDATPVGEYTARITNPTLYDANFINAFEWKLAVKIAMPITGDKGIEGKAMTMYINYITLARQTDSGEGQADVPIEAQWITARFN